MSRICIDSSLALAWLTYDRNSTAANALRREWATNSVEMVAPPIFFAEVMSVLQQQVAAGRLLREEADEAFGICLSMPVKTLESEDVYRAAWRIGAEGAETSRSVAQYLGVVETEDCDFWTCDWSLADLARADGSRVKCFGERPAKAAESAPKSESPKPFEPPKRTPAPNLDDPGLWRRF